MQQVSGWWRVGAVGLVGLAAMQFWWWNKKAPGVLNLGAGR